MGQEFRLIDMEMFLKSETDLAILVAIDAHSKAVWLPKSQIEYETMSRPRGPGAWVQVTLPEWLAIEKELV